MSAMKWSVAGMMPAVAVGALLAAPAPAVAQVADCSVHIGATKKIGDTVVGPQKCVASETGTRSASGAPFRRVEILVDGAIEGYTPKAGTRSEMLTDAPEFALAQRGNLGPYYHGIGRYYGSNGAGMTVFLPESAADWNGKLIVLTTARAIIHVLARFRRARAANTR
jgi:hypothetical protein